MSKRVSLKDIANSTGVSKTVVSWVLSGNGDANNISIGTQERINECARKMKYRPNLVAKNLRTGTTNTIGLIVPSIGDQFYAEIAKVIELEADKYGYALTFCSSESDLDRESAKIRMMKEMQVDGLIIAPTRRSKKEIETMIDEEFPFVLFDRFYPELDTNYVIIDNENSGYQLISHLIKKERCKKIAALTTNTHLLTLRARVDGYKRALEDAGMSFNENLYHDIDLTGYETEIIRVLDDIFRKVPDVDGFYFTTHILALETIAYFHSHNIDYNNRFGLACIHDVPIMNIVAPKINVARMPVHIIGREVVRILLKDITERKKGKNNPKSLKEKLMIPTSIYLNN